MSNYLNNRKTLRELKQALISFNTAHNSLRELLEEYNAEDLVELDALIGEDYPYPDSFAEIDVTKWVNKSISQIDKHLSF